ncbi:transglutaminase-like cysteine peptidase [Methylocystis sp. ATCC 49242]|uniref:transglutaminase-like cysteine peptidase n=1 Tax=Methylocystis sp. ATCC 49242 TaxID=622637 RepID=UPI0001F87BF8
MSVFSRRALKSLGLAAGLLCLAASGVIARPAAATYAPVGPETSVPFGWVDFCQRYASECREGDGGAREIEWTDAARRRIEKINAWVNRNIDPVSDRDHWGVVDEWDYPTDGKGDCEDYALLKRRMLIEDGFPSGALLLTVVKDEHGDGHSILTVRTDRGDYVLDNLTGGVKPWSSAPYRFVKRQSQASPNVWVSIGAPTSAPMYVSK